MKRIYLILLMAAAAFAVVSCEEKSNKEKFNDNMEDAGDNIKDATKNAGDAAENTAKDAKEKVENIGE